MYQLRYRTSTGSSALISYHRTWWTAQLVLLFYRRTIGKAMDPLFVVKED